jgi:hypothetical protein
MTAEGRLLELILFCQLAEQNTVNNPDAIDMIRGTIDDEERLYIGNYTVAATQTLNTEGSLVLAAKRILTGPEIVPGTDNPTFKSTFPEAALLEVLMYVQSLERNPAKNPQNINAVTGSYNSDSGVFSGSINLPIQISLNTDGTIAVSALTYLQT